MSKTNIIRFLAITLTISLLAIAVGCITIKTTTDSGPTVTGSGMMETREMDYSNFTKVEAAYAFQVDITRANSFLVSVTLDDNLFEYLDIEKRGDTLYIGLEPNHSYRNFTHRATITMPALRELKLSGASKGDISGFSSADSLQFDLSGASSLNIDDVEAGDTNFDVSGASRASGSIKIADGDFDVSGASTVELEGTAIDVTIGASGASSMKLKDFSAINVTIQLSGASNGAVNASGRLKCNLSGASRLSYFGNPTLDSINVSGGSTISQK